MIQESLVIFSCLTNNGCDKTVNNYMMYNPETKKQVAIVEKQLYNKINPYLIDGMLPIMFIFVERQINFSLGNNSTLNIRQGNEISVKWVMTF